MKRLAYLGPSGTFTEVAAREFVVDQGIEAEAELIPYSDIKGLVQAIDEHKEKQGILPIENSLEGSVNMTLDLLAHKVDLKIKAEILMPIKHNLIGHSVTELSIINKVLSHSQALAQCRESLNQLLKNFETINTDSTAEAVQIIKNKDSNWAAIGSKLVASLNDLETLVDNIQDNESNWTRFVILGHQDNDQIESAKTSLILSPVKDRPGILYEILREFATRDINLTKIESRPARKMLGDYIFFIDFEGHRKEGLIVEILDELKDKTSFIKVLGSYPQFKYEWVG